MKWRSDMVELAALAAARMDYAEDELPKDIGKRILDKTEALSRDMRSALKSNAHKIESGYNVVLTGETNVGKSSLFNALLGESRAIVSEIHGTTRDVISAELDIGGYLVRLSDTAGIRESGDEIEKMGMGKTRDEIEKADLILHVVAAADGERKPRNENEIIVYNKADMVPRKDWKRDYVSAKTGETAGLLDRIKSVVERELSAAETDVVITERVKGRLENAVSELEKSRIEEADLQAEHITAAADEIGRILGFIGSDEIYDSVFGQLCLGK
jgi:tRNA modification GTPase